MFCIYIVLVVMLNLHMIDRDNKHVPYYWLYVIVLSYVLFDKLPFLLQNISS